MEPVLTILSLAYAYYCIFYFVSAFLYGFNVKFYMDRMKTLSPQLAVNGKPKWYNILMMGLCVILAGCGAFGLWFGYWWGMILALFVSGSEAYKGATYYLESGKVSGDYGEATKHMLIHALLIGYILGYVVFSVFSGGIELWVWSLFPW